VTAVTAVVDFGSAHTVVVAGPPERLVAVEPSAVLLTREDQLVVGRAAARAGAADPARLLSRLKPRLDERDVMVGDIVLPVARLLRSLFARAVRAVGQPVDELVLTHPAGWPAARVAVLTGAASGLAGRVSPLAAPVAAAAGAGAEPGTTLLVVDVGAVFCEVSAVRRRSAGAGPAGFEVLADSEIAVGGDDLDERVREHLGHDVDARARREQAATSGSADGLSGEDLDRLIAQDVERIAAAAARVAAEVPVDRVLLVGGASRMPLVKRRVSDAVGRPVTQAADPEHAVARGALRLLTTRDETAGTIGEDAGEDFGEDVEEAEPRSAARPRPLRPFRRRVVVAAALLVLALAAAAVVVVGIGPGQLVAGLPGPVSGPPPPADEVALPPEVAGRELVGAGQQAFAAGRPGRPVRYAHPSGATLELIVTGVRAERTAEPFAAAPLGYRWLTVFLSGTNVAGPAWRQNLADEVAALDDRGQWIRPLEGGVVACAPERTPPPESVGPGGSFDACVVVPVPEATPVVAVVFGPTGAGTPPPVRFPVSVPAASTAGAPARQVGRLGEPAVEVTVTGVPVRAGFHLVLKPSGYLGNRRPAAGNRYVVVRGQLPALGTAEHVYLRDDRGVLTRPLPGFDSMPNCPPFGGLGEPRTTVYACFVYELDANVPVDGVTLGAPLNGAGREIESWPTWTLR
jgi:molecular chaperone DnaK